MGWLELFWIIKDLLLKIPDEWKTTIRANMNVHRINLFNVTSNLYTQFLLKDKKGCRRFYDIMIRANEITFENKWVREIGILNEYDFVNL